MKSATIVKAMHMFFSDVIRGKRRKRTMYPKIHSKIRFAKVVTWLRSKHKIERFGYNQL